ncbi:MAG: hypothetical protein KA206_10265 [Paludibacter sp.]|nr:hypothetical protein [Paludibacter sp.]
MNKKTFFSTLFVASLFLGMQAQNNSESNKPIEPTKAAVSTFLPKVGGFVNVRHQYSTEANSYSTGKSGFDLRRAYLILSGNITKSINYFVQGDLAGTPKLLDAFAEWKAFSFLAVQVGQFKTPITLENPYAPVNLETAENSQVIEALVYNIDVSKNAGRDLGINFNGSVIQMKGFKLLDYRLALLNGHAINVTDNNKTKDIAASLFVHPIKFLTIGGSLYKGKYGPETTKYTRDRYSLGAKYDDGKLLVRTEYVAGQTAAIESDGYYASAAYYVTSKIQPVLKYDYYNPNTKLQKMDNTALTAGVNYWITAKSRVQFNYTLKNFADSAKDDVNYFATQFLISF